MLPKKHVYLMRHFSTVWNSQGRYNGRTETRLRNQIDHEIESAKHVLQNAHVDRCLVSPMRRAKDSANCLVEQGLFENVPIDELAELAEVDFGEFEGKTPEELRGGEYAKKFLRWRRSDATGGNPPNGEEWADAMSRAHAVLQNEKRYPGNSLLIGHGYILRLVLVAAIGDLPPQAIRRLKLENGSVSLLTLADDTSWILNSHAVRCSG